MKLTTLALAAAFAMTACSSSSSSKTDVAVGPEARTADSQRAERLARLEQALAASPLSLTQAIRSAEEKTGGRAVSAEAELEHGKIELEVVVIANGKLVEVEIDASNGAVIEEDEGDDDHDDDDGDDDDDDDDDDGDDDGR